MNDPASLQQPTAHTPALARGAHAVLALLRKLGFVALGLLIAVPVLALMPGITVGGLFDATPYGSGFVPTFVAGLGAAAFISGIVAPWCDSLRRTLLASILVSQVIAIPTALQVTMIDRLEVLLTWAVLTGLAGAAVAKYLRAGDFIVREGAA